MWDMQRDNGKPVIGRVQININGGKDSFRFYTNKVADIIRAYPNIEFIFQYTAKQKRRLGKLDHTDVPFSMLFDASGGCGKLPKQWHAPINSNHKMGYSGGLGPDNISENLDKINMVVPANSNIWIDAEGKLKNPDIKQFDIARAERYIENTLNWSLRTR